MPATTFEYARQAIEDALVSGHGATRAIPVAHRFKEGLYEGQPEEIAALLAHEKKMCDVRIGAIAAVTQTTKVSYQKYQAQFVIDAGYYLGSVGLPDEMDDTYVLAADDFHRILSVLTAEGNLDEDASSNATGLAGPLLTSGASWREVQHDPENNLYLVRAFFTGLIHLTYTT